MLRGAAIALLLISVSAQAQSGEGGEAVSPPSFSDCENCPEMIELPQGRAMLGAEPFEANRKRGDLDLREVEIAYRLAVAKTEVTRGQYRIFMEETGHQMAQDGCNTWSTYRIMGYDRANSWHSAGYVQNDSHPVVCVSHGDASAYARWLSEKTGKPYRLLSSTEFEYATRAGTRGPWFWGTANADACRFANVADQTLRRTHTFAPTFNCDDGYERTAPVASFQPNAWGLYDMLGNVWEWTDDCLHRDAAIMPTDGSAGLEEDGGECERRVPRGGAWVSGTDWTRAAAQAADPAVYHSQLLGFRVALTVE